MARERKMTMQMEMMDKMFRKYLQLISLISAEVICRYTTRIELS